jgi:hypothetical protein
VKEFAKKLKEVQKFALVNSKGGKESPKNYHDQKAQSAEFKKELLVYRKEMVNKAD